MNKKTQTHTRYYCSVHITAYKALIVIPLATLNAIHENMSARSQSLFYHRFALCDQYYYIFFINSIESVLTLSIRNDTKTKV